MSKPTIVFVPGAFHTTEYYDGVRSLLEEKGYTTTTVALPSVGSTASMSDDADAIHAVTSKLADAGHQIVLVMHSYGGIPGTQSAKDLGFKGRQEAGKPGGIFALVYLAAYLLKEGMSVFNQAWSADVPDFLKFEDGLIYYEQSAAIRILYSDFLPEHNPESLAVTIKPHSVASWMEELSYAAHRDIPATYLLCKNDKSVPLEVQRKFVGYAEGEVSTVECEAGHTPIVSVPGVVVETILRAAGGS
ncbi:alpha/beta-hydrolase [Aspergillus keveii]|uniref:Alpha/beta-hydrolase n=1 Tax=Aspergillus keveii TaxID=714993 RepID=A0ABR4FJI5_9EURO